MHIKHTCIERLLSKCTKSSRNSTIRKLKAKLKMGKRLKKATSVKNIYR